MLVGKNLNRSTMAANALMRSLRLGVSATGLMLAGTALAPAAAQVLDLGGASVTRTTLPFTEVTNGALRFIPLAGGFTYGGALTDRLGVLSFQKAGLNALTLTGSGLNTYSGNTLISGGTLFAGANNVLSSNSFLTIGSGSLDIAGFNQTVKGLGGNGPLLNTGGAATFTTNSDVNRTYAGVISGSTTLVKGGIGVQTLAGASSYSGGTVLNAGTLRYANDLAFGTGTITIAGDSTLSPAITGRTIANAIVLNANVTVQPGGATTTFSGPISGAGSLTKVNFGDLNLANVASSFSGGVSLLGGQINVGGNGSLGTGVLSTGAAQVTLGTIGDISAKLGNNVLLGGQLNFELPSLGNVLELAGNISGIGPIYLKSGPGTLLLSGANTFTGGVLLDSGVLGVGSNAAAGVGIIAATSPAGIASYADNLVIANEIRTRANLQVDTRGLNLTLGGVITNAAPAQVGGIEKIGAGTLTLTGANTYTNPTTVTAGRLNVNGSITSDVAVASGATLGGTGTVAATNTVTVADGGIIAPGTSPGTLTVGNLLLGAGSVLNFELATPGVVGGGVNDLIVVTNNLTLDGTINVAGLVGFDTGTYRVINYSGVLTNSGLLAGTAPTDFSFTVDIATAGQVNLLVSFNGTRYWDGTGPFGNGVVDGGNGTWVSGATNWTNSTGVAVVGWGSTVGYFTGTGGAVGVSGTQAFTELHFGVDGYALSGGSLTSTGGLLDVGAGFKATIDSVVAGTGGLTKDGAGDLQLGGANTFTGGLAVLDGTLTAANNAALGAGTAAFSNGTTLKAGAADLTLANNVSLGGTTTFDVNGFITTLSGTVSGSKLKVVTSGVPLEGGLILSGVNTYTGGTLVDQANLGISAGNNLGTGDVELHQGQLVSLANLSTNANILLSGTGGRLRGEVSTTATYGGLISGTALVKDGEGTVVLANSGNSYAGGTVLLDGTLEVASNGALGAVGGRIIFIGNSTLRLTSDVTSARQVVLFPTIPGAPIVGTIDTVANDVSLTGQIVAFGRLAKVGSGRLTLTGATNFYVGGTDLSEGTLRISNSNAIGFGRVATTGGTTFVAGLTNNNAVITLGNSFVLGAGNTELVLNGVNFSVDTVTGLAQTDGTDLTINGTISGAGGLVTTGTSGRLFVNGNNSYSGGTTLNRVVAYLGNGNGLGTGAVTLDDFGGIRNDTGAAQTATNDVAVNGIRNTIGGSGNLALTGAVSGAGEFNKVGTGTLTLANAANTYSGNVAVNQGTLLVTGGLSGGANVAADATLGGSGSIDGTVTIANFGTIAAGVGATPGVLTIGTLNLNNNSLVSFDLGAANTIAGPLNDQIVVTGNLRLDGRLTVNQSVGGSFGLGLYNLFTYGSLTNNGLVLDSLPLGYSGILQNNVAAKQINLLIAAPGTLFQYWDGLDVIGNSVIDGGTATWSASDFNWTGVTPSAINTTWQNNSVGIFAGTAGTVTLASTFTAQGLQFQTDGYVLTGGELSTPVSTFIITDPGVTATINSTISGAGSLVKQGAGTLTLGGTNTYAGGTTLTTGTIGVASNAALGTGTLAMADDTTLQAAVSGVTLANAISLAGVGTIDSQNLSLTLDGTISGAGSINKIGGGALFINGNNSYAGGTNHTAGDIIIGSSTALGTGTFTYNGQGTRVVAGAADLGIANNFVLNNNNTLNNPFNTQAFTTTLSGTISGAGAIAKLGTGKLILTGNNSYAGGTDLLEGTLAVATDTAVGSGNLNLRAGTTLQAFVDNLTLTNTISTNAGSDTIDTQGFTFTLNGVIGNNGTINKVGSGTLTLGGTNTYAGGTTLTTGTIQVANNAALGTGALAMADGTTLQSGAAALTLANAIGITGTGTVDTNGNDLTLGGVISGNTLTKVGVGTLTINGNNSYTDGTNLNAGTIAVGANAALGTGILAMADGTTLLSSAPGLVVGNAVAITGTGTVDTNGNDLGLTGVISGGALTKVGAGTLALTATNTYTGGTNLNAGAIAVFSDAALGTGALAMADGTTLQAGAAGLTIGNAIGITGTGTVDTQSGSFALTGVISGNTLTKIGTGQLSLAAANTYSGGTNLNSGAISVFNNSALGTGTLTMADGTTLIAGAGGLTIANAIALNGTNSIDSLGGDFTLAGAIGGTGGFNKLGLGTLNLTGNSDYTGATNVVSGTLNVTGNLGNTAVTVFSGSTLTGTGVIAGAVEIANGGILNPGGSAGTLTVGSLTLNDTSLVNFELGAANAIGGPLNDLVVVNGDLTLDGLLNVSETFGGSFTTGIYELFAYSGSLTDNILSINSLPGGFGGIVQAGLVPGQVNLIIQSSPSVILYWDGADGVGNGVISGGTGTWTALSTNWTGAAPSALNTNWQSRIGVFQGAAGTVTIDGAQSFEALQFTVDGYSLIGGTGGLVTPGASVLFASTGVGASISAPISGGGSIVKQGGGTITLDGDNSYSGGTDLQVGTLAVGSNNALGTGTLTIQSNATLAAAISGIAIENTITTVGNGIVNSGPGAFTLNGNIGGAGSISKIGSGNLFLNGDNSFTNLFINNGTATVGTNTAAGNGIIVIGNNTTLAAGVTGLVLANDIITVANGIVNSGAGVFTLNGTISGAGSISQIGSGNLVLNGDNSFTNLGINNGTVTVGTNTAAGIGGIALADNTTLAAGFSGLVLTNAITTAGNGIVNSGPGVFTLNGTIGGAGSISQVGSGNLVLNGANTFTNLGINNGTVTVGTNTAAGIGSIALNNNTTLAAGVTGLVLANAITTTGNGIVNGETGVFTLNGNIDGAGSISSVNFGNLVLNGNNSFTNLGINHGTVTVGTSTAAGIGGIALADNTTLAAGANNLVLANAITTAGNGIVNAGGVGNVFTLNGSIGGAGSISQVGLGTLVLNGANTFTNLGINNGTVVVGTSTAAGIGNIALANNTTLAAGVSGLVLANAITTAGNGIVDSGPGVFTLNGNIDGAGSISQIGSGNLVLNGNNSFTNLGINNGTVTVGTNTAAGIGGIALANNTTLAAGVSGLVLANAITTAGNGIVDGGTGVFTLNGNIDGAGSISSVNVGNLVLNGNNSFTNLGINNGTVTVGTNTAAGIGGIALANNTTLAAGVSGLVLANAITTAGNGIVDGGTGVFTLNGNIDGAGSISSVNVGNLVLNGNNSFTNLGINNGTVTVGTNTAAGIGSIALGNNTTLAAGVSGLVLANAITTVGNGLVDNGGAGSVFTLNGNIDGAGSISSVNVGNLVLNGNNSFTNLGINNGTVTVGTNTAAGIGGIALATNTKLAAGANNLVLANAITTEGNGLVDAGGVGNTFTLNGNIDGAGSISSVNLGNLVLNGNNSFTNLGINNGTVTVGTNTAAGIGSIAINANTTLASGANNLVLANAIQTTGNGTVDSAANTFTLNGVISGAGSLTKVGSGTLNLTQANLYTGGTVINAGTVGISTSSSLGSGTLTINSGTLLANANSLSVANLINFAGAGAIDTAANTLTVTSVIGGNGRITKLGTGTLSLTGANTFTGGMTISAGTVTGAASNYGSGGILNNAALIFNQTTDGTFSQALSGTGTVSKIGAGTLTVSAINTITGPTTVTAGRLNVTGSLANSAVTVQTGASLAGSGTVGALTAQSGSTITPGSTTGAIATLSVNGALTLAAGSTLAIDVSPAAGGDRVSATGAASIAGNLVVTPASGTYTTFNQSFTLVSSSARTGTFASSTLGSYGAAFAPTLVYDATSVVLRLAPSSLVLQGGAGISGNGLAVAAAFDAAVIGGYNPQQFFALYNQGANLPTALSQLSGELHAAERRVLLEDTRVVREAAFDRLNAGLAAIAGTQSVTTEDAGKATTFWLRGAGSWSTAKADGIGSRFTTQQRGFLTGIDFATNGYKIGGMFHYTKTDVDFTSLGNSKVESIGGAVYGGYRQENSGFAVGLGGSIASNNAEGGRAITAPGLAQSLTSKVDGTTYQVFGEIAYDLVAAENTRIEPFVRAAYAKVNSKVLNETGGYAAVVAGKQSNDLTVTTVGLRGAYNLGMTTLSGSAGWQRASGDRSGATLLAITGVNSPYGVQAVALDRDAVALEAQASFSLSSKVSLGVGYSGVIGSKNSDHGGRATLTVGF